MKLGVFIPHPCALPLKERPSTDLGPRAGDVVASFEDLVFFAASVMVFLGPQAPPLPPPPTPPPSPPRTMSPEHERANSFEDEDSIIGGLGVYSELSDPVRYASGVSTNLSVELAVQGEDAHRGGSSGVAAGTVADVHRQDHGDGVWQRRTKKLDNSLEVPGVSDASESWPKAFSSTGEVRLAGRFRTTYRRPWCSASEWVSKKIPSMRSTLRSKIQKSRL